MKEKYQIKVESKNDYQEKKEFNTHCELTPTEYLGLVKVILDYVAKTAGKNDKE